MEIGCKITTFLRDGQIFFVKDAIIRVRERFYSRVKETKSQRDKEGESEEERKERKREEREEREGKGVRGLELEN